MIQREARETVVNLDLYQIKKAKILKENGSAANNCETSDDASYVSPPSPNSRDSDSNFIKKTGLRDHKVVRKLSIIPENDEQEEQNITPQKPASKTSGLKKKVNSSQKPDLKVKCDDVFKKLEQQGQIDDVYDINCVMEGYTLYSLRNNAVLNPYHVADLNQETFTYDFDK